MADIVKGPLAETSFDREKALRSDLARVTAERDEARLRATELGARVAAISKDLGDAWIERDALRAEVEAMREVVDALAVLLDAGRDIVIKEGGSRHTRWVEDAFDALDALRSRKVGGYYYDEDGNFIKEVK